MAVTRLKRKGRRNKLTASKRLSSIKLLTATPVIKNVDVEELKKGFSQTSDAKPAAKAKKTEAKKEAEPVAEKQEEPLKNHPTDKE